MILIMISNPKQHEKRKNKKDTGPKCSNDPRFISAAIVELQVNRGEVNCLSRKLD